MDVPAALVFTAIGGAVVLKGISMRAAAAHLRDNGVAADGRIIRIELVERVVDIDKRDRPMIGSQYRERRTMTWHLPVVEFAGRGGEKHVVRIDFCVRERGLKKGDAFP